MGKLRKAASAVDAAADEVRAVAALVRRELLRFKEQGYFSAELIILGQKWVEIRIPLAKQE